MGNFHEYIVKNLEYNQYGLSAKVEVISEQENANEIFYNDFILFSYVSIGDTMLSIVTHNVDLLKEVIKRVINYEIIRLYRFPFLTPRVDINFENNTFDISFTEGGSQLFFKIVEFYFEKINSNKTYELKNIDIGELQGHTERIFYKILTLKMNLELTLFKIKGNFYKYNINRDELFDEFNGDSIVLNGQFNLMGMRSTMKQNSERPNEILLSTEKRESLLFGFKKSKKNSFFGLWRY